VNKPADDAAHYPATMAQIAVHGKAIWAKPSRLPSRKQAAAFVLQRSTSRSNVPGKKIPYPGAKVAIDGPS
jgi:hypothetical protein